MCTARRRRALSLAGIWRSPGLRLSQDDRDLLDGISGAPQVKGASVAARGKLLSDVCREVVAPLSAVVRSTRHIEGAAGKSRACQELGAK
jgi:hypothetical protein